MREIGLKFNFNTDGSGIISVLGDQVNTVRVSRSFIDHGQFTSAMNRSFQKFWASPRKEEARKILFSLLGVEEETRLIPMLFVKEYGRPLLVHFGRKKKPEALTFLGSNCIYYTLAVTPIVVVLPINLSFVLDVIHLVPRPNLLVAKDVARIWINVLVAM